METEQALCAVCHINNFKYTCPACGIRTCCIVCVKRHKKQNECTGVVDKTKFVGRKELVESASHLNRDYNFLLNVERQIQLGKGDIKSSAKNMFKRNFNSGNSINSGNNSTNDHNSNNRNKRFKSAAQGKSTSEDDARLATIKEVYPNDPAVVVKRQNTLVIQVPSGMTRATTNKSGYDKKSGSFIWTVEWILLGSKGEVVSQFLSYKLKEHLVLGDAVPMNILNNSKSEKTKTINNEEKHKGEQQYNKIDAVAENEQKEKTDIVEDKDSKEENKEKKDIKIDKIDKSQLNLYIDNVLSSDKSQRSVLVLDKQMTIAEALKDKVVLEYPTFFITTNEKVIEDAVVSIEEAYKIKKNVEESESDESDSDSSSNSSESSDSDSSSESSDEDDGPEEESSRPPEHVRFEEAKSIIEETAKEEEIENKIFEGNVGGKVEQSNPETPGLLTNEQLEEVD
ncbi:hypothetical protein G9P44_004795 [Scheffersomyces stipitis]|nr:hypothetical protein G9P44_004795 [Scheffersomyces stipitis]